MRHTKFTSLHKAIDVIQLFLDRQEFLEVTEISEALNLPRSSAYKFLAALRERGFLDHEPNTKRYRLGLKFMELGSLVRSQIRIDQAALPFMKDLAQAVKETVILSCLSSGVAYCLERVGPESGIVFSMQRGAHLPLYAGASAKVLLAQLPDSDIDDVLKRIKLVPLTPNTITNREKLKENLREIKAQGYAYSDQEIDWGARAVAAPIVCSKLGIIAGLCVAGPTQRMDDKNLTNAQKLVVQSARKIIQKITAL